MKGIKNILWGLFAVAIVVVGAVWFLSSDLEHIEDTNGAENYSLTTITDDNIVNMDMGAINPCKVSKSSITIAGQDFSSAVEFSSEKFTGVYEVLYNNYIGKSDFVLDLTSFSVNEGNFKMVVVHDGEIVAEIEPDTFVEYRLEDISGTVSLRIAGESASYCFYMSKIDYDNFEHD